MVTIRNDLVGVVITATANQQTIILSAGDEVPDGVHVGDHVLEPEPAPNPYADMKKADLLAEVERRNTGRDEGDKITPTSDKNDDLVAALVADDA